MHQLYADRQIAIEVDTDLRHVFRGRQEDLAEMIGNLLDNACKWARRRISITSSVHDSRLVIAIEDDGPGLDAEASQLVLQRGVRRDERVPGSGLGLAIVRDLADLYQGSIALDRSAAGGVVARLELPGDVSGEGRI
jgi:signal transduction histidine kinase